MTSRCNFNCFFCYVCDRQKKANQPSDIGTEDWLSIIREAVQMGMLFASFTGGEILTRPEDVYKRQAPDYTDRAAYDSIHMPASSNGATVNLNHSVIEQKVSGTSADSSSTASNGMRVDENATVEINLVDSQIKMNTGADAYNRGIQINGANSKVVLDQSTITNDTEGSAPYVWGVQANTDVYKRQPLNYAV